MSTEEITKKLKDSIISGNIPEMLEHTIILSLESGASDIHIEPKQNIVQLRMRIDGELRIIVEYPVNIHSGIVSKIKIMADLKIDESRIPQDGRLSTTAGEKEVDLRVSSLPTVNGEKIVMRVLDKSKKIPDLSDLGIVGTNKDIFIEAISQPNGIILTSGPTGSGKTTTLYSAMKVLNKPNVNILTLEDPVENQMEGLNQSQMKTGIGYNFASGLRTALRQDPDIIMVGEIRDKETIDIAIEASLTGHLVLSTIHTNSAAETINRMLNMNVEDFLITSSVNLIIAQRLARRLCPKCRIEGPPTPDAAKKMQEAFKVFTPPKGFDNSIFTKPILYQASKEGCQECEGQGYKGRVGLYELMAMNSAIQTAILQKMPTPEIQRIAQKNGMISLEQDGLIKALQGLTTLAEVYKLVKN